MDRFFFPGLFFICPCCRRRFLIRLRCCRCRRCLSCCNCRRH